MKNATGQAIRAGLTLLAPATACCITFVACGRILEERRSASMAMDAALDEPAVPLDYVDADCRATTDCPDGYQCAFRDKLAGCNAHGRCELPCTDCYPAQPHANGDLICNCDGTTINEEYWGFPPDLPVQARGACDAGPPDAACVGAQCETLNDCCAGVWCDFDTHRCCLRTLDQCSTSAECCAGLICTDENAHLKRCMPADGGK